ncbi:MAG: hypothetical protein QF437_01225 [Planctomycetota bacterium]|jgi:hypothetical protein|nr:hypothetical protein [Planctomycetota bacterium]MDP7129073.1 hypothetical protein [Planctomycetota bacterium]
MSAYISCLLILPVLWSADLSVDDAGDRNPNTFHFNGDITAKDVESGRFQILADGINVFSQEYTWKSGYSKPRPILRPKVADLSDRSGWPNRFVEPGFVAVDPANRRFAFARAHEIKEPTLAKRVNLPNFCAWQIALRRKDMTLFLANEEESHGAVLIDASDPYDLKIVHRQPLASYVFTVALWKDHAYFGQNYHLGVLDAANPLKAKLVYEPFQNWDGSGQRCQRMAAHNGYLYTTSGSTLVWDLTEPGSPTPVANLKDFAYDVAGFDGTTGFFIHGKTMKVADVSEPSKPSVVHELAMPVRINTGRIAGKFMFLNQGGAVHIFDVKNPKAPKFIAATKGMKGFSFNRMTRFSCAVEVDQTEKPIRLYQAYGRRNGTQTVLCYDLADITRPTLLSTYEPPIISNRGRVILNDCIAHRGTLYTSSVGFGVLAIDYSDPRNPKEASYVMTGGELRGMKLLRDKLCAFGMGVYVIPTYPVSEARIQGVGWHSTTWFGGPVWGNADTKESVVIASSVHGKSQAFSIADPSRPKLDTRWPEGVNGVWIGDTLYTVASVGRKGLELLIDDTRQGAPVRQSSLELDLKGRASLTRHADLLYICGQNGKDGNSVVVDVKDPLAPKILSRFQVPGDWIILVSEIDFKYPYLFVPRKAVGVNVIDMSDPKRPKLLPPIAPIHHDLAQRNLEWSDGVYVWGDRLYVADYRTGLKVINIADIRNPKFEFHYLDLMWANYSYSVSVDGFGRYIYNGGIGIVDFIEVSSPSETPKGEVTIRLVK